MFDVSWAELGVVTAVGIAVVGRQDLPYAARMAGVYTGRFVGWLQGMRTRADRFTAQNELAHLQGQVRSSMRQLQAVQAEVMSASSVQGGGLSTARRPIPLQAPPSAPLTFGLSSATIPSFNSPSTSPLAARGAGVSNIPAVSSKNITPNSIESATATPKTNLAPASRSIAAVAETEWARQGLAFTSRAEMGAAAVDPSSLPPGSVLLAKALQESLIHDQYDRVMQEQQEAINPTTEDSSSVVSSRSPGVLPERR